MMQKLELMDIERFEQLQRVRKQSNSTHCEFEKPLKHSSTPEQREGRMSNTSEEDSSGDLMRSSAPEEDFRREGMQDADGRKGGAQSGDFTTGTEDDFMIGSTRSSRSLEADLMNIMEADLMNLMDEKVQYSATKTTKLPACRNFIEAWCRKGEASSFQHREEDSHPDAQKVFLGGLPHSITQAKLLWELRQQGYNIINKPNIF